MTFSTRNFDPLTLLAPKFPNFAIQILLFRMKHCCRRHTCTCATDLYCIVVTSLHCVLHRKLAINFYTTGVACQKQRLGPNWRGWARGASKKFGTPTYFCIHAILHEEDCELFVRIRTVEASNFKLGTQIEFGTSLPKNDV